MRQGAFQGVARGRVRAVRRRRRGVAFALAVGLGVGGCSPQAEPLPPVVEEPGPTASPSPSEPTPAPEPTVEPVTEPVPPPAMEQADEAGALAAAEYFMKLSEYAFLTGDLNTWNEISTTDCGYCRNLRERVDRVWGGGGRIEGAALRIDEPRLEATDEELGIFAVAIDYSSDPAQELDATGAVTNELPGGDGVFIVEVVPASQGWRLVEAARPPTEDS